MEPDSVGDALFPLDTAWYVSPMQAQARRTFLHKAMIRLKYHPLAAYLRRALKLHPQAVADPTVRSGGPRCGNCKHLDWLDSRPEARTRRPVRKCWVTDPNGRPYRVSRGDATTVRQWWPGCIDWEERHEGTSSDATTVTTGSAGPTEVAGNRGDGGNPR